MCGIFGVFEDHGWRKQERPDVHRLAESARFLAHRGPDNTSCWSAFGVGFVHTRLSLLDLSPDSHQPFRDPTGRFVLVYNGEVYNFRELRDEMSAQGVPFHTTGDTEVLMALLVQRGVEAAVAKIEGMFAFAFYDRKEDVLALARDRFGMKPIVYHYSDGRFVFGSEVKALRPWIKLEPDLISVASFVSGHHGPTSGASFFRGVRNLPPGTVLRIGREGRPELSAFACVAGLWDSGERDRLARMKPAQLVDQLESCLTASVKSQLVADAPVGVLCSGGVDSSLVISLAAAQHSNVAIFHADVVGRHSERSAAEQLARHLKLDLQVVQVHDGDFLDLLPAVISHSERPVTIRPDSIPFLRLCELVREHGVKGVLSGEASDECFLGYQSMMPGPDVLWNWIPRPSLRVLKNLYKRLVQGRQAEVEQQQVLPDLSRALLGRLEGELEQAGNAAAAGSRIGSNDLKTLNALGYHLRTLLHRNDTLGMAAGIESRFPFLDTAVARLAVNLPYEYKIRKTARVADVRHPFHQDKWIVRELARRRIPRSLSHRPKRAFRTNAFRRMRISPLFFRDSYTADILGLGSAELGLLETQARADLQLRLLQLEVWARVSLCGEGTADMKSRLRRNVEILPDQGT